MLVTSYTENGLIVSMASKAHGKSVVYVAPETKGSLIIFIEELHKLPEIQRFLKDNSQRFLTYDQAIRWLLAHQAKAVTNESIAN
jgi:hypothetical protein